MMVLPFIAFWLLVILGRDELSLKTTLFFVACWCALLGGVMWLQLPSPVFTAIQALLDIVLILMIFGGDVRIR